MHFMHGMRAHVHLLSVLFLLRDVCPQADANVRTVWVHDIWIDTSVPRTDPSYFVHVPTLVTVNASLPDDPYTSSVIRPYWINGTRSFEALGFAPMQAVCTLPVELDVRNDWLARGTSLTGGLFAQSIYDSGIIQTNGTVTPDLAFFNVNTFRIDDVLPAGTTLR
jgi:ribosome modulation factor